MRNMTDIRNALAILSALVTDVERTDRVERSLVDFDKRTLAERERIASDFLASQGESTAPSTAESESTEPSARTMSDYANAARSLGVNPGEIPRFSGLCESAWRAGIKPGDVSDAWADNRIGYDEFDGSVLIDGELAN